MEEYEICMGANLTCMNDHLNRMGEFFLFLKYFLSTNYTYSFDVFKDGLHTVG